MNLKEFIKEASGEEPCSKDKDCKKCGDCGTTEGVECVEDPYLDSRNVCLCKKCFRERQLDYDPGK